MKLASWNTNGLRAVMRKGELASFLASQQPDILCLQEIKIKPEQIDFSLPGYRLVVNSADRPGYSGTAMLIKEELVNNLDLESAVRRNIPDELCVMNNLVDDQFGNPNREGRVLALELEDYYIVTVYTPNAKGDLSRLSLRHDYWDPTFLAYIQQLRQHKPVIFCGDLNVAAQPIDLANPKQNEGKHGYTVEEREGFAKYLQTGLIDSFRHVNGDKPEQYTWWSHWAHARERNIGWRIDYFMVDGCLADKIDKAVIYPEQLGSDHCPISVTIS